MTVLPHQISKRVWAPHPLLVSLGLTLWVTALSYLAPAEAASTAVGLSFFAATYWLVLKRSAPEIRRAGLSLGGVFEPMPLSARVTSVALLQALKWSGALALLCFPAFIWGYQFWFQTKSELLFDLGSAPYDLTLHHLLAVALPEEMFYRGYLQSALDQKWPATRRFLGINLGWGLFAASAIFALGHLATTPHPTRLAVFFPALAFGWLRARTGGIGAAVLFHAACNLLSTGLAGGYR